MIADGNVPKIKLGQKLSDDAVAPDRLLGQAQPHLRQVYEFGAAQPRGQRAVIARFGRHPTAVPSSGATARLRNWTTSPRAIFRTPPNLAYRPRTRDTHPPRLTQTFMDLLSLAPAENTQGKVQTWVNFRWTTGNERVTSALRSMSLKIRIKGLACHGQLDARASFELPPATGTCGVSRFTELLKKL